MNARIPSTIETMALAHEIISLGAKIGVAHEMTGLPKRQLIDMHHDAFGRAPTVGRAPKGAYWFIKPENQPDASLLHCYYLGLVQRGEPKVKAILSAYRSYQTAKQKQGKEPALNINRAWYLVKAMDDCELDVTSCSECGAMNVIGLNTPPLGYICSFCKT